jgi:regulator of cell morphogenesis and NO signaling
VVISSTVVELSTQGRCHNINETNVKQGNAVVYGDGTVDAKRGGLKARDPGTHRHEEDEMTTSTAGDKSDKWEEASLDALVQFIEHTYHEPLKESLPRLLAWSEAVVNAHGSFTDEPVQRLRDTVGELAEELLAHMAKEEQVLFPWILEGNGRTAGGPIRVMQAEHDSAGRQLAAIRSLTSNFRIPEGACQTWSALIRELQQLDEDLRQHIDLENNVLFPRAMAEPSVV